MRTQNPQKNTANSIKTPGKRNLILTLLAVQYLFVSQLFAQNITGNVTDEKGETMIGVNILVKNTLKGTVTDFDGNYSVSANANDTLSVTFIGYQPQVIPVNGRSTIDIQMQLSSTDLDEYVVVGYGEVKRANLVGAVSSIQAVEIEDIPATNLSELLDGRMPGVNVTPAQPTGMPGAQSRVTIRGENTFGQAGQGAKDVTPLYIMDNFEITQDEFNLLDPSEIESISVLKDASAAVYGSKGANGVILVKTKRGQEGKILVSYSGSVGIMDATQQTEMMSAYDQARALNDRYFDNTEIPQFSQEELDVLKGLDYNWLDEAWQASILTRHTVNIKGGSEKVNYYAGGSYKYTNGNFPELGVGQYTTRLGLDVKITEGLKASVTFNADSRDFKRPYLSGTGSNTMEGMFQQLLQAPKWSPPYVDGLPAANNVEFNSFAMWETGSYKQDVDKGNSLQARLEYEFQKVKGLKLAAQFSRRESHGYSKEYQVPYDMYLFRTETGYDYILSDQIYQVVSVDTRDRISESYNYGQRYQLNLSANYNKSFGQHDIAAFVTYEQQESSGHDFTARAENQLISGIETQRGFDYLAAVSDGRLNEGGDIGGVLRLNYSYARKYLFEGTLRYEATTVFSPGERDGIFPSASFGWVMSEEAFAKNNLHFFDYIKFRYSSGLTGYASAAPFEYNVNYVSSGSYLFGGSSASPGMGVGGKTSGVASTGVSWEKSFQNNLGLDLRFLNDRLSVSADAFYYYNYDILDKRTVELPETSGIQEMPSENLGELQVWGYDMSIGYRGQIGNDFKWNINGIFSFSSNRIVKAPTEYPSNDFRYPIGQSTFAEGREEGYLSNGIIRTQEQLDAINAEWQDKWGRNYTIDGEEVGLGSLYIMDIGRPGDRNAGEPETVFEPDGWVTQANDRTYVQRVNDHLVWQNLLPTNVNLGFNWKGVNVSSLWSFAYGQANQVVDKLARTVPSTSLNRETGLTSSLNSPAFWSDFWTVDNPNAKYPSPRYSSINQWVTTFWMRDVYQLRLRNLNVSYSIPKKISNKWGLEDLRVFFVGTNLWTPVSTFDYKEDAIARYNTYPFTKTFNFGLNLKF